ARGRGEGNTSQAPALRDRDRSYFGGDAAHRAEAPTARAALHDLLGRVRLGRVRERTAGGALGQALTEQGRMRLSGGYLFTVLLPSRTPRMVGKALSTPKG